MINRDSCCKVNLLLNTLGRRPDGFHELETVMVPVPVHDRLTFARSGSGIELTCSRPDLPTDRSNLVYRAASLFLEKAGIKDSVTIYLEKHIPMGAGLGGGSGNAATTLLGLNDLFGTPLKRELLHPLAAELGSDVPFFLDARPALATGRGERVQQLGPLPAFAGAWVLLAYPGFGIPTPWAYQSLARFPDAQNGQPRAEMFITLLKGADLGAAASAFYNALEAPALFKYPVLALYKECFLECGAAGALMSGSGSTVFGVFALETEARKACEVFFERFGTTAWTSVVPLDMKKPEQGSEQEQNRR